MDPEVAKRLAAQALLELAAERERVAVIDVAERAGIPLPLLCKALQRIEEEVGNNTLVHVDPGCGDITVTNLFELTLRLVATRTVAPEKAARVLDWRDFEEFTARVFQGYGYYVYRGVYKPPPRGFEVDVVAVAPTLRYGVAVDCKHWDPRYSSPSRLKRVVSRHVERVKLLAQFWGMARGVDRRKRPRVFLPVIIVLRENISPMIEGVPVVPASKLRGFMESIDSILEEPTVRLIRWE